MRPALTSPKPSGRHLHPNLGWFAPTKHYVRYIILGLLLLTGSCIVYWTGGTAYSYPYLMLVPVLLAAAWHGILGGLLVAVTAGSMMALMPLNAGTGTEQGIANWLLRLGLYAALGSFAGWLFSSLSQLVSAREAVLRTDPRTGLPNQVALEEALKDRLASLALGSHSVGLILIRIIDITEILEALGADATDELAAAISQRLMREVPKEMVCYRYSTAEVVLLTSDISSADMTQLAQRLAAAGEDNIEVQGVPLRAQLVMGSALACRAETKPSELIHEARIAMFAAIEKHRSHIHYSPAFKRRTIQAIRLISRVRHGLEQGEFELHYQPKINLSSGEVCGCEGLLRWSDSQGGYVSPGLFMPKVESTSLIAPVTRFVAEQACQFAPRAPGIISINFSVRNLLDEDLLCRLRDLVSSYGLAQHKLEIEVTESALMQDLGAAKHAIACIRDFGIDVSIDDFGTGFASFEYLRHLPITGLKIDRSFVKDLEQDERSRRLMRCMIDVGHALDLTVTAEGVETSGQRDILVKLGCDQAQGFFYSPALAGSEYPQWLHAYTKRNDPVDRL